MRASAASDDGDDDPEDPGTGEAPRAGHFEPVGHPPLALTRICDLTPFHGALYAAHANAPLGSDGATISRWDGARFSVAFDWNRAGEPTKGGGAGQGFLRVHATGGRLFVPDADPPYNGFGLADHGTEGYVFVSDREGRFARAVGEHARPPGPPDAEGRAGAAVLPRAYHVIDTIRFGGRVYASTGSVPPHEHAWSGPSPGALHVADGDLARFTFTADYPFPWGQGVWRLTYMTRFRGRLYAGIQDYDGREPKDFVVFTPKPDKSPLTHDDEEAVRVSPLGATATLRWYVDRGRLFWVALERVGRGVLRVTEDGTTWREVALPDGVGRPTDITRFRDALFVLTEHALVRLDERTLAATAIADFDAPSASDPAGHAGNAGPAHPARTAGGAGPALRPARPRSPFLIDDLFCAAPLAVFDNTLYAGGQRGGTLHRFVEEPLAAPGTHP